MSFPIILSENCTILGSLVVYTAFVKLCLPSTAIAIHSPTVDFLTLDSVCGVGVRETESRSVLTRLGSNWPQSSCLNFLSTGMAGMMAHVCNCSGREVEAERAHHRFKANLGYIARICLKNPPKINPNLILTH